MLPSALPWFYPWRNSQYHDTHSDYIFLSSLSWFHILEVNIIYHNGGSSHHLLCFRHSQTQVKYWLRNECALCCHQFPACFFLHLLSSQIDSLRAVFWKHFSWSLSTTTYWHFWGSFALDFIPKGADNLGMLWACLMFPEKVFFEIII